MGFKKIIKTIVNEYKQAGVSDPKEDPPLSPREALYLILWCFVTSKKPYCSERSSKVLQASALLRRSVPSIAEFASRKADLNSNLACLRQKRPI